jgi:molybdopterin converting factor subunit 1
MKIQVRFFAIARELAKTSGLSVEIAAGATTLSALETVYGSYPALRSYHPHLRLAVNREYVGLTHILHENDELALIPPVSGG